MQWFSDIGAHTERQEHTLAASSTWIDVHQIKNIHKTWQYLEHGHKLHRCFFFCQGNASPINSTRIRWHKPNLTKFCLKNCNGSSLDKKAKRSSRVGDTSSQVTTQLSSRYKLKHSRRRAEPVREDSIHLKQAAISVQSSSFARINRTPYGQAK